MAYSNEIKTAVLHVKSETLKRYGAVSQNTVSEMVQGVQTLMNTDCAIATSGIAGPGGGTPDKPVGTIWIAVAYKNEISFFLRTEFVAACPRNGKPLCSDGIRAGAEPEESQKGWPVA